MDTKENYRGVVVYTVFDIGNNHLDKRQPTQYSKVYDKPGPAKAWVTRKRKSLGKAFVEGYIERVTGWEKVE